MEVLVLPEEEHTCILSLWWLFLELHISPELQHEPFGAEEALQLLKGCRGAAQKLFHSQHRQAQKDLTEPEVGAKLFLSLWTGGDQSRPREELS